MSVRRVEGRGRVRASRSADDLFRAVRPRRRKEFITTYTEVLNKFRITGTQTTMRMCKTLWGEGERVDL